MVKRRSLNKAERLFVFNRTHGYCYFCKCELHFLDWEAHHIVPFRITESMDISQLVPTCIACNRSRGGQYREREIIHYFQEGQDESDLPSKNIHNQSD